MLLTDLPAAVALSGLPVVEVPGWQTRGHGELSAVQTIVCHHTATAASAPGDYPSMGIVVNGRPDLDGPLANLGLGRSGTVYVIAAGVAFHAGATWSASQDNWHSIGIEAEHDGLSPWPADLVDAYARLCAALTAHYRLSVARVQGHKEVCKPAGRKSDPNFDMTGFRAHVERELEKETDDMPAPKDWTDEDWAAFAAKGAPAIAKAVWAYVVRPKSKTKTEQTAQAALKKAANGGDTP